jgi:hypothetical protein
MRALTSSHARVPGVTMSKWPAPGISTSSIGVGGYHDVALRRIIGEYGYEPFYFRRMLQAGAVDVLQADATRCCGITGFLRAAAIAHAYVVPLSSHTLACFLISFANVKISNSIYKNYIAFDGRIAKLAMLARFGRDKNGSCAMGSSPAWAETAAPANRDLKRVR